MRNECKDCRYFHKLKHNFEIGKGYEVSSCCIILTRIAEHPDRYDAFVIETQEDSVCEMFKEK